jgi:proline iminopeptidase
MKAKLRGTELYFDVEGVGLGPEGERPVAMLIHGGPGGDHTGLRKGFSQMSSSMQLVYFDHRGQGRSARGDPEKYNLDENVEDMEALRQYLGIGPIISIGHSYGGMVALAHAARYPASVAKLVLTVTAAHGGFITRAQEILKERGTAEQQAVCEKFWAGSFQTPDEIDHFYDVMASLYSLKGAKPGKSDPESLPASEPHNRAFGPGGFLRSFDLRPELRNITAPTLILGARHDWICAPEFSEEIHSLIPGSQLRIVEDSSHSLRRDQPEIMIQTVREFINTASPRLNGAKPVKQPKPGYPNR